MDKVKKIGKEKSTWWEKKKRQEKRKLQRLKAEEE